MMLATDFYALIGIDLVACAVLLRVMSVFRPVPTAQKAPVWMVWLSAILMVGLWLPIGDAGLSLLAFARGVLSDPSVTSVVLAVLYLTQRMGVRPTEAHEKTAAYTALALAAFVLYPTALGLGNWDAYRLGWGGGGLVMGLSLLMFLCFGTGLRLLPLLIAAPLMAWSVGVLESRNLWDYLIDPWMACVSIAVVLKIVFKFFRRRVW